MILKLKILFMKLLKSIIGEKNYTKFLFKKRQNYSLDLNNPKSLSEKIQWIKLNCNIEELGVYVDKFEVRKFVENKVGQKYLAPLLGIYSDVNEIDFDALPNSFALKATHASGWNLIVKNKKNLEFTDSKKKVDKWLNSSFYKLTGEKNYKKIHPRVIVEELINDPSGDLKDYKFFCFHGKVKFIQVDGNRHENHKRNLYTKTWEKINVSYEHGNIKNEILKPHLLEEMIEVAEKLAVSFSFVRVDLYYNSENIYFGELTFTPGQGYEKFSDINYDIKFGDYLNLNDSRSLITQKI